MTPERFNAFKAAVAALEFTEDTVELDRRLGNVSALLYYTRQEIDDEWTAARAALKRKGAKPLPPPPPPMTDEELESMINFIRGMP